MALYLSILSCICITAASYVQLWDNVRAPAFSGRATWFSSRLQPQSNGFAEERSTGDAHLERAYSADNSPRVPSAVSHHVWGLHQTRAAGPLSHQGLLQTQPAHPRLRAFAAETLPCAGAWRQPTIDILELLRLEPACS